MYSTWSGSLLWELESDLIWIGDQLSSSVSIRFGDSSSSSNLNILIHALVRCTFLHDLILELILNQACKIDLVSLTLAKFSKLLALMAPELVLFALLVPVHTLLLLHSFLLHMLDVLIV